MTGIVVRSNNHHVNPNKENTMRVTILGPNLADQSKGSFVVHAEGCRDIDRVKFMFSGKPTASDKFTEEFKSHAARARRLLKPIQAELDKRNGPRPWRTIGDKS